MNKIGSLWFSHKKCSVEELEEIGERLNPETGAEIFGEDPRVCGYAVVRTCNRVEAYVSSEKPREVLEEVADRLKIGKMEKCGIFVGRDAVEHLMRVACGLEAMIVGEDQILGQIKRCYLEGRRKGTLDGLLEMAFDRAIKVAKRARSETKINEGSVSIGSAAVELAEYVTRGLVGKSILVIGAGEMGTLVARAISEKKNNLKAMFVANRTQKRAKWLAEEVGGKAARLCEKEKCLSVCDVAITTTSAPHFILDYESMQRVMQHRRNENNLLIIDIANPKDVEERVGEIEGVDLYDLDSLYEISDENLKRRLSEVDKVERIIEEEIAVFKKILSRREVERVIAMLYEHGSRVKAVEKKKAIEFLKKGRDPSAVLEAFSNAVLSKTLHTPTLVLRKYVEREEREGREKGRGNENEESNCNGDFVEFLLDEFGKALKLGRL